MTKQKIEVWPPPTPRKIETVSDWYEAITSGDKTVSISSEIVYNAQDATARLIELHYGNWPRDDPSVVKKAVRLVANRTKQASDKVWRMTFEVFHPALADAIPCDPCALLGSPLNLVQKTIWQSLDGRAMKTGELAANSTGGDESRLFYSNPKTRKGGLN